MLAWAFYEFLVSNRSIPTCRVNRSSTDVMDRGLRTSVEALTDLFVPAEGQIGFCMQRLLGLLSETVVNGRLGACCMSASLGLGYYA